MNTFLFIIIAIFVFILFLAFLSNAAKYILVGGIVLFIILFLLDPAIFL